MCSFVVRNEDLSKHEQIHPKNQNTMDLDIHIQKTKLDCANQMGQLAAKKIQRCPGARLFLVSKVAALEFWQVLLAESHADPPSIPGCGTSWGKILDP